MRRSCVVSVPASRHVVVTLLVLLMGVVPNHRYVQVASAELLLLSINATNAPPGLAKKAQGAATALLHKFVDLEGSDYDPLAPGQTVPSSGGARMLEVGNSNDNNNRRLIGCPDSCSNSGSITCIVLGCAYCGRCRRRMLRELQGNSNNKHRGVEDELSTDLSAYCNGKPGCTIRAVIQLVNADGTVTPAV